MPPSAKPGASPETVAVAGAGSIGCFVGGLLAAAGRPVQFLARGPIIEQIRRCDLRLTGLDGLDMTVAGADIVMSEDAATAFHNADIILVTVKSAATASMAKSIAAHAPQKATIISLQNGVSNAETIAKIAIGHTVLAGMTPYNVVQMGDGRFHRGTAGRLIVEHSAANAAERLAAPHLEIVEDADIMGVLWGKLLVNLNNALNALCGLPLKEQLQNRRWRALLAAQISEGLAVLKAAGVSAKSATPLPIGLSTRILRLPTPLFRLIANRTLKIDADARSSMWEDLQKGRLTEINELQGAVIKLGEEVGVDTPVCRRVHNLIRTCENAGDGSPNLSPDIVIATL